LVGEEPIAGIEADLMAALQFRAEAFNILNHPDFGQPVNSITSARYGQIPSTRTARGDPGSSRQLQLGMKLIF
jgi:hypothetical protein